MSLKGSPTTVLHPRSAYSVWSAASCAAVTTEMTEPSRLSRPPGGAKRGGVLVVGRPEASCRGRRTRPSGGGGTLSSVEAA
jgi:hypothetical protein